MRYLFVDKVEAWKAGERIKGLKNVAMTEDFLEFHFPKNPVMPGVLLIEAFAQLSGWLEAASSDFKKWFLITRVRQCKFYSFALPGDQVEMEIERLPGSTADKGVYSGIARVEDRKKVTLEYEGDVVGLDEIEDIEEQKKFFKMLTRGQ